MKIEQVWSALEMEPTMDERAVKAQYRKLLPKHNPEDDPEGFRALREAYEAAIAYIKKGGDAPVKEEPADEGPKTEVDLWLDQIKELYKYMDLRRDPEVWKEKLDDPVVFGLDTTFEAREKLLVFLMDHHYLPSKVWSLLDHVFRLNAEKEDLLERFPAEYIRYVLYWTATEDSGNFDFFTYRGADESEAAYDRYLDMFYSLNTAISDLTERVDMYRIPEHDMEKWEGVLEIRSRKEVLEEHEELREKLPALYEDLYKLGDLEIYNPFEDLFRINLALLTEADEVTLRDGKESYSSLAKRLSEKYENPYVYRVCGEAYAYCGEWEQAHDLWEKGLLMSPDHRLLKLSIAKYYHHIGEFKQAEDILRTVIQVVRSSYTAQIFYYTLNQSMSEHYQKMLTEDPENLDSYIEYCWSLFDSRRLKETLEALDGRTFTEGTSEYYDYVDMKGRCYITFQQYEDGYPYVLEWEKAWHGLVDDGSDKYKRRQKTIHYLHYIKADCQYHLAFTRQDPSLFDEAIKELTLAIENEEDASLIDTYKDLLSRVYIRSGNYMKCVDLTDAQLKENPNYIPAILRRQDAYYHLKNYQEVVDAYHKIINSYPAYYRTYCLVLRIFLQHNQISDAESVLKDAEKNQVTEPALKLQELEFLRHSEMSDDTLKKLDKKACELLEQLKTYEFDPYIPVEDMVRPDDVWFILACAYTEYDKPDMALKVLNERIKAGNTEKRFRMLKGNVFRMKEQFGDALSCYQSILNPEDNDPKLYYYIGLCHRQLNHPDDAQMAFEKALEIDPDYDYAIYQMAILHKRRYLDYRGTYDYQKAKEYFDRLVKVNPSPFVLNARAELLRLRTELPAAIKDLEEAFEKDPNGESDDFILYRLGDLYFLNRETEKAESTFYKAIELFDGRQAAPVWQIADIFGSRGEWKKGLDFLLKYSDKDWAKNLDHQKKLAEFYMCSGIPEEAKKVYDKLLLDKALTMPQYQWAMIKLIALCYPEDFSQRVKKVDPALQKCLGIHMPLTHFYYRHRDIEDPKHLSPYETSRYENLSSYYFTMGKYFLYCREFKTAKRYLEFSLKYDEILRKSSGKDVYRALAISCYLLGDHKSANEYASKAIHLSVTSFTRPAQIEVREGRRMNTEEYYLNSMECDNAMSLTFLALMHLCKGEKDVCRKYLKQVKGCTLCLTCRYQFCYDALITEGYLEESEGALEKAKELFTEAAKICPYDAECSLGAVHVGKNHSQK